MHVMLCHFEFQSTREVLFVSNGTAYIRAAVVSRILLTLGGRWPMLGAMLWLILFPVRDLGHRLVSRCRHKKSRNADFRNRYWSSCFNHLSIPGC